MRQRQGSNGSQVITVNTTTGAGTLIGDLGTVSVEGLGFCSPSAAPKAPIPTMSSWGLMILASLMGVFGFFGLQRRKAKNPEK